MNYSIQKLVDDFISKIGEDDLKKLQSLPSVAAFNYVFFKYKEFYGDYPSGELYRILENKFAKREAA